MRRLFNRYPVIFLGLLISLFSGTISLVLHASPSDAFIITIITTILSISVEALIRLEPLAQFRVLNRKQLDAISSDAKIRDNINATLACYDTLTVAKSNASVLYRNLELIMEEHTAELYSFSKGLFKTDLRPSHPLRESDTLIAFRKKVIATSMVDAREYWVTSWARTYLEVQADAQRRIRQEINDSYVAVDRIFIEERRKLKHLIPVLRLHKELGIRARIAIFEEVPENLRRDFMVVDGELAFWLTFAQGTRTPVSSTLVVKNSFQDHLILEYQQVFDSLAMYARPPEEIMAIGGI
jgi:hypothetical protein